MVTALDAAKAYAAVQKAAATPAPDVAEATGSAGGQSFADMVTAAIGDATQTSRKAETLMAAQARGKADLIDVVTAISSAQTSLQTVLAVRDQVISAYKEILALQI